MVLYTETVKMKWNPSNRDWYTSKGYKYTIWHDEFEAKIEDLAPSSQHILEFKCDYCDKEHSRKFARYITRYKNNPCGKHSCDECDYLRKEENKVTAYKEINKINTYENLYRIILEGESILLKCCSKCNKFKEVSCFRSDKKSKVREYHTKCTECELIYRETNSTKIRLRHIKESSIKMNLPTPMTEIEFDKMIEHFDDKCALTESINTCFEHFIPVSWGHGGTHKGNIYLLKLSLNSSKGNENPFKWLKRQVNEKVTNKERVKKLIKYLAKQNKLTVGELEKFVNWCEDNKRTADQVKEDREISSVELWRRSKVKA